MKRVEPAVLWALLAAGLQPATAEVVYMKRSDQAAAAVGQQAGNAVGATLNARQLAAEQQAGYVKLDALRAQLANCGNCADRERLAREIKEMQSELLRRDRAFCGTASSMGFGNPSVDAAMRLSTMNKTCEAFNREAEMVESQAKQKSNQEEFESRVKAGDITAYADMGRKTRNANGHLPIEEALRRACPYYLQGSRKGDTTATLLFAQECGVASISEQKEAFDLLRACSDRGQIGCTSTLAGYYETTRRHDMNWPVSADDRQALKLREQVVAALDKRSQGNPGDPNAAKQLDYARKAANKVRERLEGPPMATVSPARSESGPAAAAEAEAAATAARTAAIEGAVAAARRPPTAPDASAGPAGQGSSTPATPGFVAQAPSPAAVQRAQWTRDREARRCESLQRGAERAFASAISRPDVYAQRAAAAQARYAEACLR